MFSKPILHFFESCWLELNTIKRNKIGGCKMTPASKIFDLIPNKKNLEFNLLLN